MTEFRRVLFRSPTGFFEDRDLLELAKRVRHALGLRSESVALVEPERWQDPEIAALQRETAETMRRRFGGSPLWGFKYAQTLRFLPFWAGAFRLAGVQPSFVVAVRNPLSVARSRAALDPGHPVERLRRALAYERHRELELLQDRDDDPLLLLHQRHE